MSLCKACDLLREADKTGSCVLSFTTFNMETIAWAVEVAEEEKTPIIIMYYYPSMDCGIHSAITRYAAQKASVPIAFILDHGHSYFEALDSIRCGLTSVMFDGSALPYEENVRITAEIVKAAHVFGVDVEGELGHVGNAANLKDFTTVSGFTDPRQAAEFVEKTQVDALAVAIGNAHGNYAATPDLDLKRLEDINKVVQVPLALHGGTGIPEEQIREAVKLGVNKLNIGTAYNQACYYAMKDVIDNKKSGDTFYEALKAMKPAIKEEIRKYLRLVRA
jgi:fructose-bisphosphate aldolase class II/tagatose 1,6-diphosphate aldolase GatY/KbaY